MYICLGGVFEVYGGVEFIVGKCEWVSVFGKVYGDVWVCVGECG